MRSLKFRAWIEKDDSFNKRGMYGPFDFESIGAGYEESNIFCDEGEPIQEPKWDKLIIMQFTGLHDKHGKEIWEGDVLQIKHYVTHLKDNLKFPIKMSDPIMVKDFTEKIDGRIQVKIPDIYLEIEELIEQFDTKSEATKSINVLGNIYEHPELLKEEIKT